MRIAFDLDGVLADLHEPFLRTAIELFPGLDRRSVTAEDERVDAPEAQEAADETPPASPAGAAPSPGLGLTRRQTEAIWRAIARTENFWESLKEIEPGVIARLAQLAETRDWELLFITSRPATAGRTVQRQTQRWLASHGFAEPSAFVVHGSRGRVADALALDAVVDDRPENCLDVALESKAGAILVWRGTQQSVPSSARRLGIAVVSSMAECMDALVRADEAEGQETLLARLRSVFGLRTKPVSPFGR